MIYLQQWRPLRGLMFSPMVTRAGQWLQSETSMKHQLGIIPGSHQILTPWKDTDTNLPFF